MASLMVSPVTMATLCWLGVRWGGLAFISWRGFSPIIWVIVINNFLYLLTLDSRTNLDSDDLLCFILCFVVAQNGVWKIYGLSSFFSSFPPGSQKISGLKKTVSFLAFKKLIPSASAMLVVTLSLAAKMYKWSRRRILRTRILDTIGELPHQRCVY